LPEMSTIAYILFSKRSAKVSERFYEAKNF
jgi:hypothetical protein